MYGNQTPTTNLQFYLSHLRPNRDDDERGGAASVLSLLRLLLQQQQGYFLLHVRASAWPCARIVLDNPGNPDDDCE